MNLDAVTREEIRTWKSGEMLLLSGTLVTGRDAAHRRIADLFAVARDGIKRHQAVYLIAVGGAAYLVSKAIRSARVVAFPELGMEAVYEFVVENMRVTVAVDTDGHSIHETGPAEWRRRISLELQTGTRGARRSHGGQP